MTRAISYKCFLKTLIWRDFHRLQICSPCDITSGLLATLHGASLDPCCLLQEVCVGGMMDHETVTSVRIDGGPCGKRDALAKYRGAEIEVLDKLLDVDTELAELRGHGGTRHAHLGGYGGPQAADVVLDLDGGSLLEPRGLGGHGDNKDL